MTERWDRSPAADQALCFTDWSCETILRAPFPVLISRTQVSSGVPATKARKGINPFTKEETIFKAKPARNVVKLQLLKALKEMV